MIIKLIKTTLISFIFSPVLHAELITDGSLGAATALEGPQFLIPSELGIQQGANLFHSFLHFNLDNTESANFQGLSDIQQVIVRVTDEKASVIDGLIHSEMSADFFFLNPHGFVFGAGAGLDLSGDVNFSGANYLHMADKQDFYADLAHESQLSAAPVTAFGFVAGNDSQVQFEGLGQLDAETAQALGDSNGMRLAAGKNFNVIANQISSVKGSYYQANAVDSSGKSTQTATLLPLLQLSGGRLSLVAVESEGMAGLSESGIDVSSFQQLGDIQLGEQSAFKVSGRGAGTIQVRADNFVLDDSELGISSLNTNSAILGGIDIVANTVQLNHSGQLSSSNIGTVAGAGIQITAQKSIQINDKNQDSNVKSSISALSFGAGNVGDILLQAPNIEIKNAKVEASPFSTGQGGRVDFIADNKVYLEKSDVAFSNFSRSKGAGRGGSVLVRAPEIEITEQSSLNGGAFGTGDAGDIRLEADHVAIMNDSRLFADAVFGSGNGGKIVIEANTVALTGGSYAEATAKNYYGQGGQILINAKERLSLSGVGANGEASAIKAGSQPFFKETVAGTGGTIEINAGNLDLHDGSTISNNSSAGDNITSGDAGNIRINVSGETLLTGNNPHGENREGFGSGIYAQVLGVNNNTGKGGNIELNTGSLRLEHGGVIKTNTNNPQAGGSIQVNAKDILIQGEATETDVTLEPRVRQILYLKEFVPKIYNQSVSGIYAETNSNRDDAGQSGNIDITAQTIELYDKGQISTTTKGGGIAGNINLDAQNLRMDKSASIHSDSQFYNRFSFDSAAERNQQILILGDVVEVSDDTNGATGYYLNAGTDMLRINYQYQTADLDSLAHLATEYSLFNGDMVRVNATGERYIYNSSSTTAAFKWVLVNEQSTAIVLADTAELTALNNWTNGVSNTAPYPNGTYLRVLDMGNGKPADFVYFVYPDRNTSSTVAQAIQIRQYFIQGADELNDLASQYFLDTGDHAIVLNATAQAQDHYVYNGADWIHLQTLRTVADNKARQNLILSQQGAQVHLNQADGELGQDMIYDGRVWMTANPEPTNVLNLQQRDALTATAKNGDIVQVLDTGDGRYDAFFYKDGQWLKRHRGGEAGSLNLQLSERLQMGENTKISTESNSAGGGNIQLRADQGYDIYRANISTSVQEGVGNSGNLNLKGNTFTALNQGKIIAQADAGNGGNINLNTPYYLPSINDNSLISASSRLGIDGDVIISSPNNDVSNAVVTTPSSFLNQPELALNQCVIDELTALSHFNIKLAYDGKAKSPDDFQE